MSFEILEDLRSELRDHLGVDEDELDNDATDVLLNRGYWSLLSSFPFREKEAWLEFTIKSGFRLYDVPSPFEALRELFIIDPNTLARTQLNRMSVNVYEATYSTDITGAPEGYLREGAKIKIVPLPDQDYSAIMHYWTTLGDLVNSDDLVKAPREWREIVLTEASWRGWLKNRDYSSMKETMKVSDKLISRAVPVESKEEDDSPKAGVTIYGRSGK